MSADEVIVFIISAFFSFKYFIRWYKVLFCAWPQERIRLPRILLCWVPVVSLAIMTFTLTSLASFDVVDNWLYIAFYLSIGYTWLYFNLKVMTHYLDLSWMDDAVQLNNKAALFAIIGGLLGQTVLYSGANIGDGPGWWCVIFAGGLGFIAWFVLALIVNLFTNVLERITVNRDVSCGIRFGFYLLASGILLGRAAAGDWTSFGRTIVEFADGWPILPLTFVAILVELYYVNKEKNDPAVQKNSAAGAVVLGIIFVAFAIACIVYLPQLRENPIYHAALRSGLV